ncbi:MAG: T9SS type A sorting domain-containing protein [Fimbriimonadaceae bacterium]|nr:T9SS type A sorting domain-containing protein [Chitinophagales bacterium]
MKQAHTLVLALLCLCFYTQAYSQSIVTSFVGIGGHGYNGDNISAKTAKLYKPIGIQLDKHGNLYFCDNMNNRIRKVDTSGVITTVAGSGIKGFSGNGGLATEAKINQPMSVLVDAEGNFYFSDLNNNTVWYVDAVTNIISIVAGTGISGYNGDNIAANTAQLSSPGGLCLDASGNLYIADHSNNRIRKINKETGIISTIAGTEGYLFNGDDIAATEATLYSPTGLEFDPDSNIVISDHGHHRLRRVDRETGIITTIAGNGINTFSGDGGLATEAQIAFPSHLEFDPNGNLYFADHGNFRIRKIDRLTGIISTVAGTGYAGNNGDSLSPLLTNLSAPWDIDFDAAGNLIVSEISVSKVRKISNVFVCSMPVMPVLETEVANVCENSEIHISLSGGSLGDAENWKWYEGSCDGTEIGTGTSINYNTTQSTVQIYVKAVGGCVNESICSVIEIDPIPQQIYFEDNDGDGYGNGIISISSCSPLLSGYVLNASDCDDTDLLIHPSGYEICNSIDDDCNGITDENLYTDITASTFTLCSGNSSTLQTTSMSGYTYKWFKNNIEISNVVTNSYNASAAGNYKVQANSPEGCSSTSVEITITMNQPPAIKITTPNGTNICGNASVKLKATNKTGYSWQWYLNDEVINGATKSQYTAKTAGTYKCSVSTSEGCSKFSSNVLVTNSCKVSEETEMENGVVKIYPNPASEEFTISLSENITMDNGRVEIYNMQGMKITEQYFNASGTKNTFTIQLPDNTAAGIHLVKIYADKEYNERIIIM